MTAPCPRLTTDDAIGRLAARVRDATLPHGEWTHEAHFAFALWMLRHEPALATPAGMRAIIMGLNDAQGTPNTDSSGYHHAITVASIGAASHVLELCGAQAGVAAVLSRLMASPFGRSEWILQSWSRDRLFSPEARKDWVAPDLEPLPW